MPKYIIEREIPGVGSFSDEDFKDISQKSCAILNNLGTGIHWIHSYVTDDKLYCVFHSANKELIREHAEQGGFPANAVSEIRTTIDPSTSE